MAFKLVRTDSDEQPFKLLLEVGNHLFGRGKFLDCDDKRVSRNHGELEVTEDTVVIRSLHQNPCFVIRKTSDEIMMLQKNCTLNLCNGDKFGLLPNSYWYELLHWTVTDVDHPISNIREVDEDIDSIETEPFEADNTDVSQEINFNLQEPVTNHNPESPKSPSLIQQSDEGAETNVRTPDEQSKVSDAEEPQLKRAHNSEVVEDAGDLKKIKTEDEQLVTVKPEPIDTGDASNPTAGPSNDQGGAVASANNEKDKDNTNAPNAAVPANPIGRERCMYGANCYRRNPQHKAQFSHPSDADWGGGARGLCPWGAACRRRDPRHWHHHDHPPGTLPPNNHPGMQVVHRHGNTFYINAHSVNFYDDHFEVMDSDGDSVDYDYEF